MSANPSSNTATSQTNLASHTNTECSSNIHKQLKRKSPSSDTTISSQPQHKKPTLGHSTATTASNTTIRFLILSDTHYNDTDAPTPAFNPPDPSTTPPIDVLLHCGDLTETGTPRSLLTALECLAAVPASLRLVIAGNHDITLDAGYHASQGGAAGAHAEALRAVRDAGAAMGVTFLDEGTHEFAVRGRRLRVHASPWTPAFGASAFQYPSAEDRFNPAARTPAWAAHAGTPSSVVPEGVDVVLTHGPPKYVLDDTGDGRSAGCEHLRRAVCRVRPRLCAFGHVHRGYGVQRVYFEEPGENAEDDDGMRCLPKEFVGKNQARRRGYASLSPGSKEALKEEGQTLMVNAAVMDEDGERSNMPWLVEMEF